MKTLHPDLFPETLLVCREGDRIFTTSIKVAEHFKKRHDNVLRAVENVVNGLKIEGIDERKIALVSEFAERNFALSNYQDSKGRTKPMYKLTEEGFAILAMGFTGAEAMVWKIEFLNAFRDMERQLYHREARFAQALDQVRPFLRPVVEATERGLRRAAIAESLGKSAGAITYHRGQGRRFGLLDA